MAYFIGWLLFLVFFKIYFGFKTYGRENVPKKGAFILVSNHTSYLDPILLGASLYRSLNYMARENLFRRPLSDWIMRRVHCLPVKRGEGDFKAIKDALNLLKEGKPLVIFPEGTRSKDKALKAAKPGVGFLVAKARVPVIPAYVEGSFEALPRGFDTMKRHPVEVYFGKPVYFDSAVFNKSDKIVYQKMSDEIMRRVAQLKEEAERNSRLRSQTGLVSVSE